MAQVSALRQQVFVAGFEWAMDVINAALFIGINNIMARSWACNGLSGAAIVGFVLMFAGLGGVFMPLFVAFKAGPIKSV